MLDNIFGSSRVSKIVIITVLFVFLFTFPILSKFTENSASSNIVVNNGFIGSLSTNGGNNYVSIDNLNTEENVKDYLNTTGAWNATIKISNEAQLQWYKKLTSEMEKTYVEGTTSNEWPNITGIYAITNSCLREYDGDFAIEGDECEYNGYVNNQVTLDKALYSKTCKDDNKPIFPIKDENKVHRVLYYSTESTHIVGGKILGKYPDALVSASLANTYSLLDQNNSQGDTIKDQISSLQDALKKGLIGSQFANSVLSQLFSSLAGWYSQFQNVASADAALADIFDEGSLYTTFRFMSDSECVATDVPRYMNFGGDKHKVTNEYGELVDYTCVKSLTLETECNEKTETCTRVNPDTKETESYSCTKEYADNKQTSDGYVDSYYVSKSTGEKWCDYEGDYQLQVEWICKPTTESPIKCSVSPVVDDRGTILYYRCVDISENAVRTKIVDPVFDAYEENKLDSNGYLTHESAIKYVYSMDEEEEKKNSIGTNPKGYKISNEIREIVTKHIVMEILGDIEGRDAAVADEDGNFYLQSYNRVLNEEQYKDALKNTIFVKDNILRKDGKLKDSDDKIFVGAYSEKLYGVFYSEYNPTFDEWDEVKIEQQKRLDNTNKNSLILEIFSTYEYVTYYLEEHEDDYTNGSRTGSGLSQVDPTGYAARTSKPVRPNEYYFFDGLLNEGECAWYAKGRVKEILASAGSDYNWTYGGNGGTWCDSENAKDFTIVKDYTKPKKGSIVVWKYGAYGHVAVIESVNSDGTVDISEAGLAFANGHGKSRDAIWAMPWGDENSKARKEKCEVNGCFNYASHVGLSDVKLRWGSYRFACYIYLLRDDSCPGSYSVDDNVLNYINSEFNSNDSKDAKIDYYNFLTGTEGGTKLDSNFTKEYLAQPVNLIGNIEGTNYASVDPGLYLGEWDKELSIDINGKKYTFNLTSGCTVPRWVALYKFLELYKSNRSKVLTLISNKGLSNQINSTTKIHSLMRLVWTYGEGGATSKINELLDAYKSGGDHDVWCKLSGYVLATHNGVVKTFGNYFNMNEMIFDLFLNGTYSGNRNYKDYKYYTYNRVNNLLNKNYPKYSTSYLEKAMSNGELPSSNSYSDCDGD